MKKIFLLFILISGFAFGQFKVVETSADFTLVGKYLNTIKLFQKNGKARINYFHSTNGELQKFNFEFSTEPDTLTKIHELIKGQFIANVENEITLEFPEGNIYLYFFKPLGTSRFVFRFDDHLSIESQTRKKRESDVMG